MFILFFLMIFCFDCNVHAVEPLTMRWLNELPASAIDELASGNVPDILQPYQHQQIKIHGFVYKANDGQIVLAAEPDLKSCCVGSQRMVIRQVILKGDDIAISNDGWVKEIQGRFEVQPTKDENGDWKKLFVLYDAKVIKKNKVDQFWIFFLIGMIAIAMAGIFVFFKKNASPHRDNWQSVSK